MIILGKIFKIPVFVEISVFLTFLVLVLCFWSYRFLSILVTVLCRDYNSANKINYIILIISIFLQGIFFVYN